MPFEIRTEQAAQWMNKWEESFGPLNPDPASIKTLIFLTLLERQGESTSYQNIADELKNRGVLSGEFDDFTPLRNGMAQIVSALKTHDLYEIENRKSGKESSYRLKRRGLPASNGHAPKGGRIVKILDDPELTASTEFEYVAERLIKDRKMPFYGTYLPMTAASRWVLYSEGEAKGRGKFESQECERLLGDWLSSYEGSELCVVGLGVGEGIGEIEIIERLLDKKKEDEEGGKTYNFSRIHYCAIDTNVHLLMDHVERLKHRFKGEIESRKLVCGVIAGNFLEDFSKLIRRMREEFAASGLLADSAQGFLPNTGTLVSILGNVVGNLDQRSSEWSYFRPVLEEFENYDLTFLLGVSVQQAGGKTSEKYPRELEELLLATPRYLTHELGMLKSHQPEESTEKPEFVLPEDEDERAKRWPPEVTQLNYMGDGILQVTRVTGKLYEFYYQTRWDLSMQIGETEKKISAGSPLLLYNIIKFDEKSLISFLESMGLFTSGVKTNPSPITSGNEDRRYVIIAVKNNDQR